MTDLAVSEVIDGEIVEARSEPPQFELYTRKRRESIISALKGEKTIKTEDGEVPLPTKAFIADAARFAGISPKLLYAWIEHGRAHPTGPLGRFAREVDRIRATHNVELKAEMEELARLKKDWTGMARIGEQYDAETWSRPSDGKGTNITVNIIDKLNAAQVADGHALTSGD